MKLQHLNHRPAALAAMLLGAMLVAACDADKPEDANADAFIKRANEEIKENSRTSGAAYWVRATYITPDTAVLAAAASERDLAFASSLVKQARHWDGKPMSEASARSIALIKLGTSMPAPDDAARRRELADIATGMEGTYGSGKYCETGADGTEQCRDLEQLSDIIAASRDYDELQKAWSEWRTISVPMRPQYQRFVELVNEGAGDMGYADLGAMWRSGYDMSPADFVAEVERLWDDVEPLYSALHCYARTRLAAHYGEARVPSGKPIPAHLFGNMWAQQWGEIYDLLEPYPGVLNLDISAALRNQGHDPVSITKMAEGFFTSLGLPELPDSFYENSLLQKPRDRDVVCHASAWDLDDGNDPRIKQCIEPTEDHLSTVHHELGHIYYYLMYKDLPPLLKGGAHDGFHEAIGDTVVLSMTPEYMRKQGLIDQVATNEQAVINQQMKMALDKIAFLPFGKLIDQWRWQVFSGEIAPDDYNAAWWRLRQQYQGIAPPVARSEADFDPGAKYHIPGNTPYTRYFLAHILQFQFHQALCEAAGHIGPLHSCSIYGSAAAGRRLGDMLAMGQSQPWPDALEKVTGGRQMDSRPIIEYFAPLMSWLEQQNSGQVCGW